MTATPHDVLTSYGLHELADWAENPGIAPCLRAAVDQCTGALPCDQCDMPAADALRPVALRRVDPPFVAITLRWLHDDGERALLDRDFAIWAQSLLASGEEFSYDDFATIDACPLPPPAPLSLAGSGFLAGSGPPDPAMRPAGLQMFVKC